MGNITSADISATKIEYNHGGLKAAAFNTGYSKGTIMRMKRGGWTLKGYKAQIAAESEKRRTAKAEIAVGAAKAKKQPEMHVDERNFAGGVSSHVKVDKGQPETIEGIHHHNVNMSQHIEIPVDRLARVLGREMGRVVLHGMFFFLIVHLVASIIVELIF